MGVAVLSRPLGLARNDPRQCEELADEWCKPRGAFADLYWLGEARAELVPASSRPDAVLIDVACGGGLLARHIDGYRRSAANSTSTPLYSNGDSHDERT